jgi:hypothetical protein
VGWVGGVRGAGCAAGVCWEGAPPSVLFLFFCAVSAFGCAEGSTRASQLPTKDEAILNPLNTTNTPTHIHTYTTNL